MGAYVYMLSCADGSYYVGSATGSDLKRACFRTSVRRYDPAILNLRRPVQLVWSEYFDRVTDAIADGT